MRKTTVLLLASKWKYHTVEWSPKVAAIEPKINCSHFILPDLPSVYSPDDRAKYLSDTAPKQRILTVSTCQHTPETLKKISADFKADRILLVGGNNKTRDTLSTVEAAKLLKDISDIEIWGVANPNNPTSLATVEEKLRAGITGIVTQPLLASHSLDVFESYPRDDSSTTYIAGLAMPTTAKNLQFWCRLLEQPELEKDPLFQAHLAFFSQPYYTSIAWIGRELENLSTMATIDGVHFMPLGNVDDLQTIFRRI